MKQSSLNLWDEQQEKWSIQLPKKYEKSMCYEVMAEN